MSHLLLDQDSIDVWPCLREERLGGWRLRFGGGAYGRSNSVQPYGAPSLPLVDAIDHCERAYLAESLTPTFRLPEFAQGGDLEGLLADRGYQIQDATNVQLAMPAVTTPANHVAFAEDASEEWLATYLAGSKRDMRLATALALIQRSVPRPRAYASIQIDGAIVSVGVGSIHKDTVWIFSVATLGAFRGRGLATDVTSGILAWAHGEGASAAALQVAADNEPALALYSKFGFKTEYRYHYRRLT